MNKKKIIKIGIPVAAGCIVLALGIGFAVKNSGKAVKVAPVSSVNSGGWYDDSGIASYGTVTTNQKQDIYVDDTMPITQVYVKAGDTVKVGDRLVAYDTTLSSLELEMKEMQIQGIDLNIQNLQKEITQLKGTKTAKADTVASVVQQRRQFRVCQRQPAPLGNAVGLVVEPLGIQLVPFVQSGVLQYLSVQARHTVGGVGGKDGHTRHMHHAVLQDGIAGHLAHGHAPLLQRAAQQRV